MVSPGMNLSPIINPSGGVMRCSPEGTGGKSRRVSLMQAWRNFILESLDWSSSVAPGKQVSNSCWSLTHSALFVAKRKNRLDRVAAVVSLNMEELLSFPFTPALLLCACSTSSYESLNSSGIVLSSFCPVSSYLPAMAISCISACRLNRSCRLGFSSRSKSDSSQEKTSGTSGRF